MKNKLLKVKTIDSLFAVSQSAWGPHNTNITQACQDPLEFLNPEFILKAFIPALLAGLVWILPLCAIAAPASLTSIAKIVNETTICQDIPTLNFTKEAVPLAISEWKENMCFWSLKEDGTTYYFNSPSDRLVKISTVCFQLSRIISFFAVFSSHR
jgi:hypothetical protein